MSTYLWFIIYVHNSNSIIMPVRVSFHPNRMSFTPHPAPKHFEDELEVSKWNAALERSHRLRSISDSSLRNLNVVGNPFLLSGASKKRMQDRIIAMYRLATPRSVKTHTRKILYNFKCNFVTLTLPSTQMHSDKEIKEKCLNQLLVELRKYYGVENYVWKAELQVNQNIHFHIVTDQYISYYALRRRWNRILDKLGYIDAFRNRMEAMSFEDYYSQGKRYNSQLRRADAMVRYKQGQVSNWSNPNSVDVKMVRSDKEVAIYMSKYMVKDIVDKDKEELSPEELSLLERGKEFGRSWFCSRSLSRLDTKFSFSLSKAEELVDLIVKAEGTKFYSGDFFRVWYFRFENLSFEVRGYLRGWLLHNAHVANYNVP